MGQLPKPSIPLYFPLGRYLRTGHTSFPSGPDDILCTFNDLKFKLTANTKF